MSFVRRSTATFTAALLIVGVTALPAAAKTDKQIAKSASITKKDVGRGWTTTKQTDDPPSGIPECEATEAANRRSQKYEFESPQFEQGDSQVTNSVYVFKTVKQAKQYLATYQDGPTIDCLQQGLDEALLDTPGATADVAELDVSGGPADDGVGYLATITIATEGGEATLLFEAVAFRAGRGVTGITTQNIDEALPITADLATASIQRLKKGLR